MSKPEDSISEPFSASYSLISDADIFTHPGGAIMDAKLYDLIESKFGEFFIAKVGTQRYDFQPIEQIPSMAAAVPKSDHDNPRALLIRK